MVYSPFAVLAVALFSIFLSTDARPAARDLSCAPASPSSASSAAAAVAATPTASPSVGPRAASTASPPSPSPASNDAESLAFSPDSAQGRCFPALGFKMPDYLPLTTLDWWCDATTEYAFMGFSYEITACQSPAQLQKEFYDIRHHFNSRYIRLYGVCDNEGYYDDIVTAAWNNGLGVHALVWFGFTGGDQWIQRRDALVESLYTNPKAKFVTRGIQFGSEPLYDSVLPPDQLAYEVRRLKEEVLPLGIPVTVSELAYGYQKYGGAQNVLDAEDYINIHMLPFFSQNASTSDKAWPLVMGDLDFFVEHGNGKKMYFDENGWPSVTSPSVQPNSCAAVANVQNEAGYFQLLEEHCEDLKNQAQGGVGWFAHIYSDNQEPGYGIYDSQGRMKFDFAPRTTC